MVIAEERSLLRQGKPRSTQEPSRRIVPRVGAIAAGRVDETALDDRPEQPGPTEGSSPQNAPDERYTGAVEEELARQDAFEEAIDMGDRIVELNDEFLRRNPGLSSDQRTALETISLDALETQSQFIELMAEGEKDAR